ncbi:Uncharacterised protein [Halioglobus japonicus]|nr:Uncharacterised protein [Halioglobus japonicus]
MWCCSQCIGDKWLGKEIIPFKSLKTGTCSYCRAENQPLVSPTDLGNNFELLVNIYTKNRNGKFLVEWFREDWAMFPLMDVANSKQLLSDILDDGEIVREKYSPSELCNTDRLHTWEQLKTELMHENRFFPNTRFDESRLKELLSQLLLDSNELSEKWYRARIQREEELYPIEKMGAPPKRLASHGRANPAGIPYLYLASTPETAVSEIRPHTGEYASVADFTLSQNLKFVDLRDPKVTVSPFISGDENEVALLRGDIEFLVRLGHELTRPVLPHAVAIDYIPSQYLCEFIKKCGYHGVVYRSSVGEGINLALFDPEVAAAGVVERCLVSRVLISIEK